MIFDIEDMFKTNEDFKRKLKGLIDLNEYKKGKLGVYNNTTYVSWNYFQGLQRRFYNESIDNLIVFLNSVINEYYIFYNMINHAVIKMNEENEENEKILILEKENEIFIRNIYNGLNILKQQYETNENAQKSITELIKLIENGKQFYIIN